MREYVWGLTRAVNIELALGKHKKLRLKAQKTR